MEKHLSPELIGAYRQQQLRPAELIQVDDHLTGCAICRRHLEAALQGSALMLHADLLAVNTVAPHLTFDQMARYVDETLDRTDSRFVADHLTSCIQCERAVNDLRTFIGEDAVPSIAQKDGAIQRGLGQSHWRKVRNLFWPSSPLPTWGWALAALLFIVLVGWLIRSASQRQSPVPELADQGRQPSISPLVAQSFTPPAAVARAPEAVPLLAQLTDGTGQVTLDQQGRLSGLDELPPVYQRMVQEALTTQQLARPASLEGLNRHSRSLMGGDEQGGQFTLLAPVGKVVFSDRPAFQWRPLDGATAYIVEIYDEQFNPVLKSEALQQTEWTPSKPLARGRIFAWQITATKDRQQVLAPKPPATQARFRVLAQPQAEEIVLARRSYASSHLTLGLLYAQAGLLDEAEQEMRALRKANPDSPLVRRLLTQIQALGR